MVRESLSEEKIIREIVKEFTRKNYRKEKIVRRVVRKLKVPREEVLKVLEKLDAEDYIDASSDLILLKLRGLLELFNSSDSEEEGKLQGKKEDGKNEECS